jgi:hypothetical protein
MVTPAGLGTVAPLDKLFVQENAMPPMLSEFPGKFDGAIPLFTGEGTLPTGDFLPSRLEFEMRFVNTGDTLRRSSIYEGWNRHRRALIVAGSVPEAYQLLDGSYTTAKDSPGDIDIAVEVRVLRGEALKSLTTDDPVLNLLQGPRMKPRYDCDAYPIFVLPKSDPSYTSVTTGAIQYWTKWFGRTRTGTEKGRVWATTGGFR